MTGRYKIGSGHTLAARIVEDFVQPGLCHDRMTPTLPTDRCILLLAFEVGNVSSAEAEATTASNISSLEYIQSLLEGASTEMDSPTISESDQDDHHRTLHRDLKELAESAQGHPFWRLLLQMAAGGVIPEGLGVSAQVCTICLCSFDQQAAARQQNILYTANKHGFSDDNLHNAQEIGLIGIGLVDSFGDLVPPRELNASRDGALGIYKREGERGSLLGSAEHTSLCPVHFCSFDAILPHEHHSHQALPM